MVPTRPVRRIEGHPLAFNEGWIPGGQRGFAPLVGPGGALKPIGGPIAGSPFGPGFLVNAFNQYATGPSVGLALQPSAGMSLVWAGAALGADDLNYSTIFGAYYSAAEPAPYYNLVLKRSGVLVVESNVAGTRYNIVTTTDLTTGVPSVVVLTADFTSGVQNIYLNGVVIGTQTVPAGSPSYSGPPVFSFSDPVYHTDRYPNTVSAAGYAYNSALSAGAVRQVTAEPFGMLEDARPRTIVFLSNTISNIFSTLRFPGESLGSLAAQIVAPIESISPQAAGAHMPLESIAGLGATAGLPTEALGHSIHTYPTQADSLGTQAAIDEMPAETISAQASSQFQAPSESLSNTAMHAHQTAESLAETAAQLQALLDTTGTVASVSYANLPLDSIAGTAIGTDAGVESSANLASQAFAAPAESTSSTAAQYAYAPLEVLGIANAQLAAALESLATGPATIFLVPMESTVSTFAIVSTSAALLETLASAAQAAGVPLDYTGNPIPTPGRIFYVRSTNRLFYVHIVSR